MPHSARLSPDQYRLLVESSAALVWRAGLDAQCNYFNDAWLTFTGRALADELGDGWLRDVHVDDRDRVVATYLASFAARTQFTIEMRLRRRDGVYRWVASTGVPFPDEAGNPSGFVGSCVDIHERRELDRAKTTFLSLMAHELRTPLTTVSGSAQLLLRHIDRGSPVPRELAMRLLRQIDRFAALIGDLGDAARLEADEPLVLARETVDLRALVSDVVARQREVLDARHARTKPVLDVVADQGPFRIEADPTRLAQAVSNVVENAVKFSAEGGRIEVRLRDLGGAGATDGGYALVVRDQGIGVPKEELGNVGRRYFRASNASARRYPGVGLGLALSREIIDEHGGRLDVQSELGRGTVVTLRLPYPKGVASR